jgi:Predicted transcriptional regulators
MIRGGEDGVRCEAAMGEALRVLGGKWSYEVISRLYYRTLRFNELRRSLGGITVKSLTDIVRQLESLGIVRREVIPTTPVGVEYSLTEKGKEYRAVLMQMREWGEKWGSSGGLDGERRKNENGSKLC